MTPKAKYQPIRVAIIGLSASAVASWAADAHLPALLSPRGRQLFELKALCNSSVEAAEAAVKHYGLPPTTKKYGNVQDLANDPDIDLVICSTRVDKHYDNIVPSIKAGKDIYVEWPVASSAVHVRHIAGLAQEYKVRVAVGVQGRYAPPVRKFRQILDEGKFGKLLSSELRISGGISKEIDTLFTGGWEYFADKKVGGNHITIHFGHAVDQVQSVVGRYSRGTTTARPQIQHNKLRIVSADGELVKIVENDVPDLLLVHGTLEPSELVVDGATLTASFHREWAFPGQSTLIWTMLCEKGIVRLDVTAYPSLQADAYSEPVTIRIQHFGNGDAPIEHVPWSRAEDELQVAERARDTLACLCAFAEENDKGWVDITEAVLLTEQLEAWVDGKAW